MQIAISVQKLAVSLILGFSLATCSISCATMDCSVYKADDPKKCRCIRENGDQIRARECSMKANKKYRERMKKLCFRTCFTEYDCSKCEEL